MTQLSTVFSGPSRSHLTILSQDTFWSYISMVTVKSCDYSSVLEAFLIIYWGTGNITCQLLSIPVSWSAGSSEYLIYKKLHILVTKGDMRQALFTCCCWFLFPPYFHNSYI